MTLDYDLEPDRHTYRRNTQTRSWPWQPTQQKLEYDDTTDEV